MKKKLLVSIMALTLLLTSCRQPAAPPTPTAVAPEPTATVEPTQEAVATFEEAPCPFEVPEDAAVESIGVGLDRWMASRPIRERKTSTTCG